MKIKDKKKFTKRVILPLVLLSGVLAITANADKLLLIQNQYVTKKEAKQAEAAYHKYQEEAKLVATNATAEAIKQAKLIVNEDGTVTLNPTNNKNIKVNEDGTITFTEKKSAEKLVKLKNEAEEKKSYATIYAEAKSYNEANQLLVALNKIKEDKSEANMEEIKQDIANDNTEGNQYKIQQGEIVYPQEETKAQFLREASEAAKEVAKENGLLPSIMVAQAIIESAWGQSGLAQQDNNYFGVKFRGTGNYSVWPTSEFYNGQWVTIEDKFQKYDTMKESFQSNADVLRTVSLDGTTKLYADAWLENVRDTEYPYITAANGLQGKYATSPEYAQSLIHLIETYGLNYLDAEVL